MSLTAPFNYDVPVSPETTDRNTGKKSRSPYFAIEHIDWFLEQQRRAQDTPEQLGSVSLTAQNADIAATPVPMPDLTAGRYRISYYTRITTVAGTSSELIITIGWTDIAQAMTSAGATLNGNLVTTFEQRTLFLDVAANASITYAVAYTSDPVTVMKFKLQIVCEKLPD